MKSLDYKNQISKILKGIALSNNVHVHIIDRVCSQAKVQLSTIGRQISAIYYCTSRVLMAVKFHFKL